MRRTHGGKIEEFCDRYGLLPEEIMDFSSNVNFLGSPSAAYLAIQEDLTSINRYPDTTQAALKESLSYYLGVPKNYVMVGNGSAELIFLLCRYFRPRNSLVFIPTFSEYELAVRAAHGAIAFVELDHTDEFAFPASKAADIIEEFDLAFLCNPNNPTGTLVPLEQILDLMRPGHRTSHQEFGGSFIVDEAFIDFTSSDKSLRIYATYNENLLVIGSLTKFFSIPGLRLGYLITQPHVIEQLELLRDPWSINCFANAVGRVILQDKEYMERTLIHNRKNRAYLVEQISAINGLKAYNSEANFVLVEIQNRRLSSVIIQEELAKQKILIRDCSSFRGLNNRFIRLAVRSIKDIDHLISSLNTIVNSMEVTKHQLKHSMQHRKEPQCG